MFERIAKRFIGVPKKPDTNDSVNQQVEQPKTSVEENIGYNPLLTETEQKDSQAETVIANTEAKNSNHEIRLQLDRDKFNDALLCFQDNVKFGATAGGVVGAVVFGSVGYCVAGAATICCTYKDLDKAKYARQGKVGCAVLGGAIGACSVATFSVTTGCISGFFAYHKGRPAQCNEWNNKINQGVANILLAPEPAPASQQMR